MSVVQRLFEENTSGTYFVAPAQSAEMMDDARARGYHVFSMKCDLVGSKSEFMTAAQRDLGFGAYFGENWDAFEECVQDMVAEKSKVLLLFDCCDRFARAGAEDFAVLAEILHDFVSSEVDGRTVMAVITASSSETAAPANFMRLE